MTDKRLPLGEPGAVGRIEKAVRRLLEELPEDVRLVVLGTIWGNYAQDIRQQAQIDPGGWEREKARQLELLAGMRTFIEKIDRPAESSTTHDYDRAFTDFERFLKDLTGRGD